MDYSLDCEQGGWTSIPQGRFTTVVCITHTRVEHGCLGVLFREQYILTTAVCVDGAAPSHITVFITSAGDDDKLRGTNFQVILPSQVEESRMLPFGYCCVAYYLLPPGNAKSQIKYGNADGLSSLGPRGLALNAFKHRRRL